MNAVNAVQLFILVWTFTSVCQADGDISVSCEDVTGSEEVTFTCSVSLEKSICCIEFYKFLYPEKYNDSAICREEFPQDSCEQRNSFTCSFSPTTVMTGEFRFFLQTYCGSKITEFNVNITEPSKSEPDTEDPGKKETSKSGPDTEDPEDPVLDKSRTSKHEKAEGRGFKVAVIAAVVSCFIIVIMLIIYKMKQKRMFPDNNTENVINVTDSAV